MVKKLREKLLFSTNWNNKLNCKAFSTIRIKDRFELFDKVEVFLKKGKANEERIGNGFIAGKYELRLHMLKDYMCYLDTGYNATETRKIIRTMYKKYNLDWTTQSIFCYLIVMEKE